MAEFTQVGNTFTASKPVAQHGSIGSEMERPSYQIAWFLAVALLTRFSVFGDPNYHNDELLFAYIGQQMHNGLWPYVDIWDRKGPGLFVIYYLIGGISKSVVTYQVIATIFAAATAQVINRIAGRFTTRIAAMLAGTAYLCTLTLFAGGSGQAPVFYNLFTALAGLLVISLTPQLRQGTVSYLAGLAMLLAGISITFKQTAFFEGVFLGLWVLWLLYKSGASVPRLAKIGAMLALAGALPMLLAALVFALAGHFAEFWHAMVTSNLTKTSNAGGDALKRLAIMALIAVPLLLPAIIVLFSKNNPSKPTSVPRDFLAGWVCAAIIGLLSVPNFIEHYALPILLPLAVAAAPAFTDRIFAWLCMTITVFYTVLVGPAFRFDERAASREAMKSIVAELHDRDPQLRLFVFEGPSYLYALTGSKPPSPLLFPTHLFQIQERNTSHLNTKGEVAKILAWRPTVIVRAHGSMGNLTNPETSAMVENYTAGCRLWSTHTIVDYYGPQKIDIYGNCAPATRRSGD